MIAFGTIAGGAGAALTGGNFWQGAVTGLIVSGLNHAMHSMNDDNDDIVRINTKDKTAEVEKTQDNFDRIIVDGKEVMCTKPGALDSELRDNGYSISMKGPQGVGMGLVDFVGESLAGAKVFKTLGWGVSKLFGKALFNSKSVGYTSKLFGRYHPKYLPDGTKGVLNSGIVRTGWGNNAGVNTFRTSFGHTPNQRHIDWFFYPR